MSEDELFGVQVRKLEVRLRGLTWSNLAGKFFKRGPADDRLAASIPALRGGAAGASAVRRFRFPHGLRDRPRNIVAHALHRDYRLIGPHAGHANGSRSAFIVRETTFGSDRFWTFRDWGRVEEGVVESRLH